MPTDDRIMMFSWDQAPSAQLEKLVNLAAQRAQRAYDPGGPGARFWVWLERRRDEKDRVFVYVRLDAQLYSSARPEGWRVRVESAGTTPEQSCRRAFRALEATWSASRASAPVSAIATARGRAPAVRRPSLTGLRSVPLGSTGASAATARS
jgi:hypothetical protein